MKKILFILLLLNGLLFGEEIKLSGTVYNFTTKSPIKDANIYVDDSSIGTTTDINGEFILKGNFKNKILIISFVGYETKTIYVDSINNFENLKIALKQQIINSQTVLIEGISVNKKERMFTYSILDKSDITDKYTVQDIPELISNLPSAVFYSESGNGIGYNYLNIRGFDQRRISVSVNGIPQNEPEDHNV
nr:TonB-dependent receptor [Melioribacteraceae bacterium]